MSALSEGMKRLGIEPEPVVGRIELYLSELELWNKRTDLVKATGQQLIVRHVLDSLSGLPFIRALPHATVADVGSGAGFPGIPLSLLMEDSAFTLIERSARRASFLRTVVTLLDLKDRVRVLERDLSEIRERFSIVTFRAFRELSTFAPALFSITAEGGAVVAFKGKRQVVDRELADIEPLLESAEVTQVVVPGLEEQRHILVMRPLFD